MATTHADLVAKKPRRGLVAVLMNLRESWVGMIGLAIILFWVVVALLAPIISPYDPLAIQTPFAKPGSPAPDGGVFWLGADHLGRDVLSRVAWGSRTVLIYAPLATFCAYFVGIIMGHCISNWSELVSCSALWALLAKRNGHYKRRFFLYLSFFL